MELKGAKHFAVRGSSNLKWLLNCFWKPTFIEKLFLWFHYICIWCVCVCVHVSTQIQYEVFSVPCWPRERYSCFYFIPYVLGFRVLHLDCRCKSDIGTIFPFTGCQSISELFSKHETQSSMLNQVYICEWFTPHVANHSSMSSGEVLLVVPTDDIAFSVKALLH